MNRGFGSLPRSGERGGLNWCVSHRKETSVLHESVGGHSRQSVGGDTQRLVGGDSWHKGRVGPRCVQRAVCPSPILQVLCKHPLPSLPQAVGNAVRLQCVVPLVEEMCCAVAAAGGVLHVERASLSNRPLVYCLARPLHGALHGKR